MRLPFKLLAACPLLLLAVPWPAFPADLPVEVRIVTDEADAALAILGEQRETGKVKPESWDRLWQSRGFVRQIAGALSRSGARDVTAEE